MLPSPTRNLILSCLSPLDLVGYSRTSRATYNIVAEYCRQAFNINKRLSRYFTFSEIILFKEFQARTGMLISGSTALQFFDRTEYPDSDLDIYVEHRHGIHIAQWLQDIGYAFAPRKSQDPDIDVAYEETWSDPIHHEGSIFPSEECGYFGRGVAGVFNFHKEHPERKIQLITSLHSPIEIILHFHSTCVMNIITHSAAYAFYPKATFEQRRSLICATSGSKQDLAREKYLSRGWTMEHSLSWWETLSPSSNFRKGNRWVGDKTCWRIKIAPDLAPDFSVDPDYITSNSWKLAYSNKYEAHCDFLIMQFPLLRYRYILADNDVAKDLVVPANNAVPGFDDFCLNRMLRAYFTGSDSFRVDI